MFPYIGGKKQHSKWIDPFFPEDANTYVEVFGGAMWMYWMSGKLPVHKNIIRSLDILFASRGSTGSITSFKYPHCLAAL